MLKINGIIRFVVNLEKMFLLIYIIMCHPILIFDIGL